MSKKEALQELKNKLPMRSHRKQYHDEYVIDSYQAAMIVSENSEREVKLNYIGHLVRDGRLPNRGKHGQSWKFFYGDVKDLIVTPLHRPGRKLLPPDQIKKRSEYMRAYRARKEAEKAVSASSVQ